MANGVSEEVATGILYMLGPGTTIKPIADRMGVEKTLLGVDVVEDCKLVIKDANERQLIDVIKGRKSRL